MVAKKHKFSLDTPFKDYPKKVKDIILYGTGNQIYRVKYNSTWYGNENTWETTYDGLIEITNNRYLTSTDSQKQVYEEYMTILPCKACHGKRLKPSSLAVTINDKNISDVCDISIGKFKDWIYNLKLTPIQAKIGELILKEIKSRINFLINVGLDYLSLSRMTGTLSGGEAQRIRLATQIGTGLVGVCYILDEPSIGLHQRDNDKLINTLKYLRDLGNTVLVVEHDEDTMKNADYIVDIGPYAGVNGGRLVACGTYNDIIKNNDSITGKYLSHNVSIPVKTEFRRPQNFLKIIGAKENNLKNIDVSIPLSVFTCVTGVSGSGKSSLITEILYNTLARKLNKTHTKLGNCKEIIGIEKLDKIIMIDQSPIGKTPRSNPATYTGVYDMIRDLYAETPDAKERGYSKGRFSFNVKGGRCEKCEGDGLCSM